MLVNMGFDSFLLQGGITHPVTWNTELHPHLLVLGNTGAGKTYFLRSLLGRIALYDRTAQVYLNDFKGVDFSFIRGIDNARYWGYTDVAEGFTAFYTLFEKRLQGNDDRSFCLLLIDEYIGWLNSMEKKTSEETRKRMSVLLFMGRALNIHVVIGCQRAMAQSFDFGSRDMLNPVFLGAPSRESVHSFCDSEEAASMVPQGRGKGYVLFDGSQPRGITVPAVRDEAKLQRAIVATVTRC